MKISADEYNVYEDENRCTECEEAECICYRGGPRMLAYTLTAAAVLIVVVFAVLLF